MKVRDSAPAAWGYRVFVGAWTLYAGYYVCRKDLGLPSLQSGSAHFAMELACFGITYAIGNLVGGVLADRWSARRTAVVGAGIAVVCTILLAWASPPFEMVLQLGNGFGQGFGWPSLLKLIGACFGPKERDRVLGWWSTSYILGGFLATTLAEWLATRTETSPGRDFYPFFLVAPAILLCCALYFSWQTSRIPPEIQRAYANCAAADSPKRPPIWSGMLKNRSIRYISAMYFFLKMTRYTLLFWLPHYLITSFGYTTYAAARTASSFEIVGCIGPIAAGYAMQRAFARNRLATGGFMLYALAFLCLIHPMLAASGWLGMILSISLMGILVNGSDMLLSGMAVLDAIPEELHGRAVGFVNSVGSAGQTLSPLLATLFVAHYGWTKLFDLFVFFSLVSGVICTFGARSQTGISRISNPPVLETSTFPS